MTLRDRLVYFAVGAFLGFLVGACFFMDSRSGLWPETARPLLLAGGAGALVLGLLAAWLGERFFELFSEHG